MYFEINLMISSFDISAFCNILSMSEVNDFISSLVIFKDISFSFSISIMVFSLLIFLSLFTLYCKDLWFTNSYAKLNLSFELSLNWLNLLTKFFDNNLYILSLVGLNLSSIWEKSILSIFWYFSINKLTYLFTSNISMSSNESYITLILLILFSI